MRQGCPLSLPLYCIIGEVLTSNINNCTQISGFPLPGKQKKVKVSQYADDTTIICTNTSSIHHIFNIFHQYELATGATLNSDKTFGLELGGFSHKNYNIPFPIKWEQKGCKILGVVFHTDTLYMSNQNWTTAVNKLEKHAEFLQFRNLSLKGKSILINTVLLSKVWYLANILIIPIWARKKINQIIFDTLWDTNSEPINRETLFKPLKNGGLNILNITNQNLALLIKHTLQITDQNNQTPWTFLAKYWLSHVVGNLNKSWQSLKFNNQTPKHIGTNIPTYYQKQIHTLKEHKNFFETITKITTKNIYNQLQTEKNTQTLLRCETFWNTKFQKVLPWKNIWKHNFQAYTKPKCQNIIFKIHHNILPSNAILKTWQRHRGTQTTCCKACGECEDTLHIFATCTLSKPIWNYFKQIILKIDPSQTFSNEEFTLLINLAKYNKHNPKSKLILTIITIILNQIWICRNAFKFENKTICTQENIDHVIYNIKHIIKIKYNYHKRNNSLLEFKELP